MVEAFLIRLENINYGDANLTEGMKFQEVKYEIAAEPQEVKGEPQQKGDTKKLTLSLFKEGKSIAEISKERNLKPMTIEGHLSDFVRTGEVEASELIAQETIDILTPLMEKYTLKSALKPIKENIPEHYSYFDIKVMLNYLAREK